MIGWLNRSAYTAGMMENGIGTDEYLKLVSELQMEPSITIRLQLGDEQEIQEARDWVEYCNGNATTKYGALRAQRGPRDIAQNRQVLRVIARLLLALFTCLKAWRCPLGPYSTPRAWSSWHCFFVPMCCPSKVTIWPHP